MRTREEILKETSKQYEAFPRADRMAVINQIAMLEVLLDIRELLANPEIEVTGTPMEVYGIMQAQKEEEPTT